MEYLGFAEMVPRQMPAPQTIGSVSLCSVLFRGPLMIYTVAGLPPAGNRREWLLLPFAPICFAAPNP
jgi:hypothetical protein